MADDTFACPWSQGEIFEEVSQLVQSALDGYKVCLFSYGQTGSGKTHTMLGEQGSAAQMGIIPRAVAKIVEAAQAGHLFRTTLHRHQNDEPTSGRLRGRG